MSNVMLQTLLKQANEAIESDLKQARSEAWKDNAFENNKNDKSSTEQVVKSPVTI
ncbi:hypothetical protein ACYT4K_00055 [Lactococcus lactis]|uniref:hypothetical protein n=1 Tax=Lactococcus lactis TaxID=1358 RepID=UPI0022E199C2|nr:hypothetical protein [Lactococcus lactis]MDA2886020.1 hypothetical protein [Lactococcus lactis]MDA2888553.1 hypothetical protein [Lactococcus lactis]MDA2908544.1 hypothetical protein [Lactococcus lactis]